MRLLGIAAVLGAAVAIAWLSGGGQDGTACAGAPDDAPEAHEPATWREAHDHVPLADAAAAARVLSTPEPRPANEEANGHCPTAEALAAFRSARDSHGQSLATPGATFNPYVRHVTGRFTGTTDEIIQWAAHKWGIHEDWLRAQYATESQWRQDFLGDRERVANPEGYPDAARTGGSEVYESMGLSQVKWRPDGSQHAGTEPLRWKSTAFAVDFAAATVRFYYDDPQGRRTNWGDESYAPGDRWLSIGGWFAPTPWHNEGQRDYVAKVRANLRARVWERPDF